MVNNYYFLFLKFLKKPTGPKEAFFKGYPHTIRVHRGISMDIQTNYKTKDFF